MTVLTVGQQLNRIADLFDRKSEEYGDSYKNMGKVLVALFPNGITLKTEDELNRFVTFVQLVFKVNRYAHNYEKGGHMDSMDDLSIYSQIMNSIDVGPNLISQALWKHGIQSKTPETIEDENGILGEAAPEMKPSWEAPEEEGQ
jgi:hypothetical protein